MRRAVLFVSLLVVSVSLALVSGQTTAPNRAEEPWDAWDRGDYIDALQAFRRLLAGPDAATWRDRIALTTGELFEVTEIAPDGRQLRVSPTGRYAAFEAGTRTAPLTRVAALDGPPRVVADIRGSGLAFSPTADVVAFLRARESSELAAARAALDEATAQPAPDRQAIAGLQRKLNQIEQGQTELVWRDLKTGQDRTLADGGLLKSSLTFSADGAIVYFVGSREATSAATDIFATSLDRAEPQQLTSGPGVKTAPVAAAGGQFLVYQTGAPSPFGGAGAGGRPGGGPAAGSFAVQPLDGGPSVAFNGSLPTLSSDGTLLAFASQSGEQSVLSVIAMKAPLTATAIRKGPERLQALAVAPDGSRIAFQQLFTRNYEIFAIGSDGQGEARITREIQHDTRPLFLSPRRLVAIKGESRHSRSYLYDLASPAPLRLFHNNSLRTIAPEYEWAATPDGARLLVVAERDGDTISPERGVYPVDLTRKVSTESLVRRIDDQMAAETALRARGAALFKPVPPDVRALVERVSMTRLSGYQAALFDFDSKHITQPGNAKAGEYVFETLASFGYQPEYQWFTANGVKTANVLATLRGTRDPDLVYVLSSHYDSNLRSPGGDDNSSATAVLLETARLLVNHPLPATVIFAAFTGEEAGLLGSREFVRQARAKGLRIVGALNNDMIGWSNDHRLDNTIRYSNAGIRDLQHAAAFLFSKLVTYDAKYYKSTDAAAYFEAYGDIVGGLGSYPVLGNPNYHQATDLLETVNHELVVEDARFNIASIVRLAHGPSRIQGLTVDEATGGRLAVHWNPSPETSVATYRVRVGPPDRPATRSMLVNGPKAVIAGPRFAPGENLEVSVTALDGRGMESWDAARAQVTIPR